VYAHRLREAQADGKPAPDRTAGGLSVLTLFTGVQQAPVVCWIVKAAWLVNNELQLLQA
jgi:hypothetical protein